MFFPGAVLEPEELRSILARTGEYSDRELEKLTLENVQQHLQRLRNRDASFDYQVTFVPHVEQRSWQSSLPGLIARVTDSDKQIALCARCGNCAPINPRRRCIGSGNRFFSRSGTVAQPTCVAAPFHLELRVPQSRLFTARNAMLVTAKTSDTHRSVPPNCD